MGIQEQLYKKMYKNASGRGIEWELDYDYWLSLVGSNCHYCGIVPSNRYKYGKRVLSYSGLDRLDSGLGYTAENVVPSCRLCNVLKSSLRPESWFDFLKGVIESHDGEIPKEWANFQDPERARKAPNYWGRGRKR